MLCAVSRRIGPARGPKLLECHLRPAEASTLSFLMGLCLSGTPPIYGVSGPCSR